MPTYQYACTACDHRLEAVQSFTDDPLSECPVCEGRLRKLFNAVGIVFKGSGFYRTDSRAGANGKGGPNRNGSGDQGDKSDKSDKSESSGGTGDGGKSTGDAGAKGKTPVASTSGSSSSASSGSSSGSGSPSGDASS